MLVTLVLIGLTTFAFADYLLASLRPEAPSLWTLGFLAARRRRRAEPEVLMPEAESAFEEGAERPVDVGSILAPEADRPAAA